MKLSIIIPIYNVELYLPKCLDSIFSQELDKDLYEVIAINDGSPDGSLTILEKYQKQYDNLFVINQENCGVAVSRNKGISYAKGDYVIFVDPDDWISENSLNSLYRFLNESSSPDIVVMRSILSESNLQKYDWSKHVEVGIPYSGSDLFINNKYFRGSVCGVAFNKIFLDSHNLRFPENVRNCEDTIFFCTCQVLAKSILFFDYKFYYIFSRPGSASKTISSKHSSSFINALEFCDNFKLEQNLSDKESSLIEFVKYILYSNFTYNAVSQGLSFNSISNLSTFVQYLPIKLDCLPFSKFKVRLLNLSYRLYFIFVKIIFTIKKM